MTAFQHTDAAAEFIVETESTPRRWNNMDGSEGGLTESWNIDETAYIGEGATIGPECSIGRAARIAGNAIVGRGVKISGFATIKGEAIIESGAYLGFGSRVSAGAKIGKKAVIGVNAYIGAEAVIGDGVEIPNKTYISRQTRIEAGDWFFTLGPIGTNNNFVTAVCSAEDGILRFWMGDNVIGETTDGFVSAFDYPPDAAEFEYLARTIEGHPSLAKFRAARAG